MTPTAQMVNAWLAGQTPTISPCSIAQKMLQVSTLAAGRQAPIRT